MKRTLPLRLPLLRLHLPLVLHLLLLSVVAGCGGGAEERSTEALWPVSSSEVHIVSFQPELALLGVFQAARAAVVRVPADGVIHYPAALAGKLAFGRQVAAGEVLATVVNPSVDLGLTEARLALESAQADHDRAERSFAEGLIPHVDLDHAKMLEAVARARFQHASLQSAHLEVKAPISGRLRVLAAVPDGAQVGRDLELAEIVGGGDLQVAARAAPDELPELHPGLAARLRLADGSDAGGATLSEISPVVDGAGTVLVLARLTAAAAQAAVAPVSAAAPGVPSTEAVAAATARRRPLLAGEGVELRVALDSRPAIVLPEEAVVMTAAGEAVFVIDATANPLRARLRSVSLGGRAAGRVAVRSGLRTGDRVVERGTAALSDGAAVVEEPAGADGGVRGGVATVRPETP